MPAEYLLLMAACLAVTLPLECWLRARVYRRWRRLLLALVPVVLLFSVWDVWAIGRGHWDYSPDHTTGWILPGGLPVEELVFFVVIPICGLLTYEAVGTVLRRRPRDSAPANPTLRRVHKAQGGSSGRKVGQPAAGEERQDA